MTTQTDTDPPEGETVTADALATWLGLTANRVHALGRDGVLPRVNGKKYLLQASVAAYCTHCRSLAKGKATDAELTAEKLRLAREQADKIALQNAAARAELLDAQTVASEWRGIVTDLRAAILAVPSRVASELGFDRKETIALDSEIRAAMEAIADDR
jgi:phage terminase Nu1 subunit (DNA packaging protein)